MIHLPKVNVIYLNGEGHTHLIQCIIRAVGVLITEEDIKYFFIRLYISFWEWLSSQFIINIDAWKRSVAVIKQFYVFLHQIVTHLQGYIIYTSKIVAHQLWRY